MDTCKYIVIDTLEAGPAVFMFPPFIQHSDFVIRYFGQTWFEHHQDCRERLLSAGFVRMVGTNLVAYGESQSLKLKADPTRDYRLLNRLLAQE